MSASVSARSTTARRRKFTLSFFLFCCRTDEQLDISKLLPFVSRKNRIKTRACFFLRVCFYRVRAHSFGCVKKSSYSLAFAKAIRINHTGWASGEACLGNNRREKLTRWTLLPLWIKFQLGEDSSVPPAVFILKPSSYLPPQGWFIQAQAQNNVAFDPDTESCDGLSRGERESEFCSIGGNNLPLPRIQVRGRNIR